MAMLAVFGTLVGALAFVIFDCIFSGLLGAANMKPDASEIIAGGGFGLAVAVCGSLIAGIPLLEPKNIN